MAQDIAEAEDIVYVDEIDTETPVAHAIRRRYGGKPLYSVCGERVSFSNMGSKHVLLRAQFALQFALQCKGCLDAKSAS